MEKSHDFAITKPGKGCEDVSKFPLISLLNIGGKVLEKVLINRINHVFSQGFMNANRFGFIPQKVPQKWPWQLRLQFKKAWRQET